MSHLNGGGLGVNAGARRGRRPKSKPADPDSARLQQWLDDNGFTSAELEAVTGMSRQAMTKIRRQVGDVRRTTMIRILDGACVLARRKVRMEEIFVIEPEKWSE
jgi:DNA-binding Xre family transcriptional regulator